MVTNMGVRSNRQSLLHATSLNAQLAALKHAHLTWSLTGPIHNLLLRYVNRLHKEPVKTSSYCILDAGKPASNLQWCEPSLNVVLLKSTIVWQEPEQDPAHLNRSQGIWHPYVELTIVHTTLEQKCELAGPWWLKSSLNNIRKGKFTRWKSQSMTEQNKRKGWFAL